MDASKTGLLNEAMEQLFDSKQNSDMTFIVHGKELLAHKLIITSRSEILKAMIYGPMAPIDVRHLINDPKICFDDFENFLRYLYTDQCDINKTNIERMLHLGDMYGVKSLMDKCVTTITTWFDNDNILKFAELGLLYSDTCNLLNRCLESLSTFVPLSLAYISEGNESHLISTDLALKMVAECPRSKSLTEDLIFVKIFQWAQLKAAEQILLTNTDANLKSIMQPFIPHFAFDRMSPLTLATHVFESKILAAEGFSEIISKVIISKSKSLSHDFFYR